MKATGFAVPVTSDGKRRYLFEVPIVLRPSADGLWVGRATWWGLPDLAVIGAAVRWPAVTAGWRGWVWTDCLFDDRATVHTDREMTLNFDARIEAWGEMRWDSFPEQVAKEAVWRG